VQHSSASSVSGGNVEGAGAGREVVRIPVLSLRSGGSPRLEGEDKAHIARLAESEGPLPPILVDRRTMRVIDGMHRLMAASLKGQQVVEVEFFDGSPADAFLRAVQANVTHGLPLSLADRRAAAARIIALYPQMSDRAVGETAGLAARTVAAIRRRSSGEVPQLNARVGRDGKVRPLRAVEGRRRAAALLAEHPEASLREVARGAGVSPATARDVRRRLERGEEPVRKRPGADERVAPPPGPTGEPGSTGQAGSGAVGREPPSRQAVWPPEAALAKLLRDPSLRHTEQGRRLLRLLQLNAVGTKEWPEVIEALPPHCAGIVMQLAREYGQMWLDVARELNDRARISNPWDTPGARKLTPAGWPARLAGRWRVSRTFGVTVRPGLPGSRQRDDLGCISES
jgi:ParB-like chromosome segregation protein Spo0J